MNDIVDSFRDRVLAAGAEKKPLRIRGSGSKDFYGNTPVGETLDTCAYTGIVAYEPTELFITAKAGTPLSEVEATLAKEGQYLAFEAPHFGGTTVGGCVASGLSGPRRAAVGSVRDFVLGVQLLDGKGNQLIFGGQVMKNVAGYDVSRLMAGAMGTLGLLLEVSLKVLPKPPAETSLRLELSQAKAIEMMNRWGGQPLPISATCWHDGWLTVRLSGARAAVATAQTKLGGEAVNDADAFWRALCEQETAFFSAGAPLWRLSVPSVTPALAVPGEQMIEWGGALRWLKSDAPPEEIRAAAASAGGHATLYRAPDELKHRVGAFSPLSAPVMTLNRNLKTAFDPQGIFNPGRMYREL